MKQLSRAKSLNVFSHVIINEIDTFSDKVGYFCTYFCHSSIKKITSLSVFIKYRDFTVVQKQGTLFRPTDVTAVILNQARRMLAELWDGKTPIRQVGMGLSKLTREEFEQMTLFEDPEMEWYREWDREYDKKCAQAEDPRTLAYERQKKDLI